MWPVSTVIVRLAIDCSVCAARQVSIIQCSLCVLCVPLATLFGGIHLLFDAGVFQGEERRKCVAVPLC